MLTKRPKPGTMYNLKEGAYAYCKEMKLGGTYLFPEIDRARAFVLEAGEEISMLDIDSIPFPLPLPNRFLAI